MPVTLLLLTPLPGSQGLRFSPYLVANKIKLLVYSQGLLDCSTGRGDPDCHAQLTLPTRRSQVSHCPNSIAAGRFTSSEGIKRSCVRKGKNCEKLFLSNTISPARTFTLLCTMISQLHQTVKLTSHQWDEMPPTSQMKDKLFWWRHSLDLFKFCLVLLEKKRNCLAKLLSFCVHVFLCKTLSLFISNSSEVEIRKISNSFYTRKRKFRRENSWLKAQQNSAEESAMGKCSKAKLHRKRKAGGRIILRSLNFLLLAGGANAGFISLACWHTPIILAPRKQRWWRISVLSSIATLRPFWAMKRLCLKK